MAVSEYSTRGGTSGKVWRADDALLLEAAQAERERARADARERALELAEAAAPCGEVTDDEDRPLAADDVRCGADRADSISHTNASLAQDFTN